MTVHRDKFLIIKPTRCTNFSNLFWNETLHVSDSSSVHHQEFFTVHTVMVYVIQVFWQLASRIRMERSSILILLASCQQTCITYTIAVCTVKSSWWWTEELSETCRVSFQNKFEKLVHLVGFIIRKWIMVPCKALQPDWQTFQDAPLEQMFQKYTFSRSGTPVPTDRYCCQLCRCRTNKRQTIISEEHDLYFKCTNSY